jgi:hypothetical protein
LARYPVKFNLFSGLKAVPFRNTQQEDRFMTYRIARTGLASLFAVALIVGIAVPAHAEGPCSLARAAGTYGFSTSGTVIGVGSRVSAGIITLDAAGNATGKATSSLNGAIADEKFSGTYTLSSDCRTTLTAEIRDLSGNLLLTVTEDGVWDDNMREIRGVFTSATLPDGTPLLTVISIEGRKMIP